MDEDLQIELITAVRKVVNRYWSDPFFAELDIALKKCYETEPGQKVLKNEILKVKGFNYE